MTILNISQATIDDLKQLLNEQKVNSASLRIASRIGWGGTSFYLVLDEPVEGDEIEEHDGIQFLVKKKLYDRYSPFTVSSTRSGGQIFLQIDPARGSGNNEGCGSF